MKKAETSAKVGELFDLLSNRDGLTVNEIRRHMKINNYQAHRLIRKLRLMFEDDPACGLVCDPQGRAEQWRYRLVGTVEEGMPWAAWMVKHQLSRIATTYAVWHSILMATDGRTVEGRAARTVVRHLGRLREDIAELDIPELVNA